MEHAQQARKGQWQLAELPWDEPVKLAGTTRRERMLCKFDLLDAANAIFHLKLGGRRRMGDLLLASWGRDERIVESLEWLDTDELRHLRALRRLDMAIRAAGREEPENEHPGDPRRMWRVAKLSRNASDHPQSLALRVLVDESVARSLLVSMSKQTRVPLARAVFAACASDDARHRELMTALLQRSIPGLSPASIMVMQSTLVAYVARLQNALRPYYRSFAGVMSGTSEEVAREVFLAISQGISELGPGWNRYPTAKILHAADRSAWMLWVLR